MEWGRREKQSYFFVLRKDLVLTNIIEQFNLDWGSLHGNGTYIGRR